MHVELPADRIVNWPKSAGGKCERCGNDGQIEVADGPGRTIAVPCPDCAIGFRTEFRVGVKMNSKDQVEDAWWAGYGPGPWGLLGYWYDKPGDKEELPAVQEQLEGKEFRKEQAT